jgi:hypothetical protein
MKSGAPLIGARRFFCLLKSVRLTERSRRASSLADGLRGAAGCFNYTPMHHRAVHFGGEYTRLDSGNEMGRIADAHCRGAPDPSGYSVSRAP